MSKFKKKPVVIDAWRFNKNDTQPDWLRNNDAVSWGYTATDRVLKIKTLEGEMVANPGDWIIRGIKGEMYPCKPGIFEATYEPVD